MMKNNKHIQKFNEHQENLNISDVSDSNFSLEEVGMVLDWLREFVYGGEQYLLIGRKKVVIYMMKRYGKNGRKKLLWI